MKQREASGTIVQSRVAVGPAVKRPRISTLSDVVQDDSGASSSSGLATSNGRVGGFASSSTNNSSSSGSARKFWDGAVKRVANDNEPDNDSHSFKQIINGGEKLEMAIVGAYCLDVVWVCSHFDPATELLLVMPRSPEDKEGALAQISDVIKPNTYRVIPAMTGINSQYSCMVRPHLSISAFGSELTSHLSQHTKMIVVSLIDSLTSTALTTGFSLIKLYFSTSIRIVIPTANAVDYDWAIVDNVSPTSPALRRP